MPSPTSETLRTANRDLRAGIARLLQEPNASAPLRANDLSGLLEKLVGAAGCVRGISADSMPEGELENAISEYRRTIEELAQILPRVHGRLLTEKACLEIAQAHLTATAAWAEASQKTL